MSYPFPVDSRYECEAVYPHCGCVTYREHLDRNPCIETLGRMIVEDRRRHAEKAQNTI